MEPAQSLSVAQFTIAPIQNASTAVLLVISNATILSQVLRTKSGEAAGRYAIPIPSALRHRLRQLKFQKLWSELRAVLDWSGKCGEESSAVI
jgi:hypothetical protein